MNKYVVRLGLAVSMVVALLCSLSLPAQADDSQKYLMLGDDEDTEWKIENVYPGLNGSKKFTLKNISGVLADLDMWVSTTAVKGASDGTLDDWFEFTIFVGTSKRCQGTIHDLPNSNAPLEICQLKGSEKVEVIWDWELPSKAGNDTENDSFSFTITYRLVQSSSPSPPSPPSPSPPSGEGEEIETVSEVRGVVCTYRITQLTISPYEVHVDEPVTVGVLITNPCDEPQGCEVILKINGVVEASKWVVIKPHETKRVTFTTSKHSSGSYSIEVNGYYAGTLTVKEVVSPVSHPPKPKPFPWWLIVSIGLGAAALASLITYLVYRRKKQAGGSPGN